LQGAVAIDNGGVNEVVGTARYDFYVHESPV
jgi:hypothetical protein